MVSRARISIDLGLLKPLVQDLAAKDRVTPAAWAAKAVQDRVREQQGAGAEPPLAPAARNRDGGAGRVKFGGWLTLEQSDRLRRDAGAARLSQIDYVGRLVMGEGGAARPQLLAELRSLGEQLSGVRQELVQALRVGCDGGQPHGVAIEKALAEVRRQARAVASAMDALATTRQSAAKRGR